MLTVLDAFSCEWRHVRLLKSLIALTDLEIVYPDVRVALFFMLE